MTQSLACLGVIVAVLAALWRWDLPARPAPDAAVVRGKAKPQVRVRIAVKRASPDQDNSNTSYAALGLRACPPGVPESASPWVKRAAWRVQGAANEILKLKPMARKSILGPVT